MPVPVGNYLKIDGELLVNGFTGGTIEITSNPNFEGVLVGETIIWTYSGTGTFLGLSRTQGATTPDSDLEVGDTTQLASQNYDFYSVVSQAPESNSSHTQIGSLSISKKMFGPLAVIKEILNGSVIYEASVGPVIDPVLANNSWDVIAQVCKSGDAGDYWAVGDSKSEQGTDGYTRYYRIADMSGLYSKHVVFEQYTLDGSDGSGATGVKWDNNNVNNYQNSQMRSTHLPAVMLRYSSELQAQLENTSYQVATNGNDGTLLTLTDKIFLPAGKEIGYTSYSRAEENSALTTFQYYQTHTTSADHIKYDSSNTAMSWWTRSPNSGGTNRVVVVVSSGNGNYFGASGTYGVSPVFAW